MPDRERNMSTTRQMERETLQASRDTMRNAAEETGRVASTAAGATAEAARAGVDLMQRNLETAQSAWEVSSRMTSELIERSMGQFARTTGISGRTTGISGHDAKTATRQASHGFQGLEESAAVLATGMQDVSREWLDLCQKTLQKTVGNLDRLRKCRNAPEMLAAQTEIFRDNLEELVQSTRRMAELFAQTAERATRKTSEAATSS